MDNNITNPTLSPDQWLATLPIPQRRAPTLTLRGKFASRAPLPDIAPDRHGVMRWADETTWIPEPQPTWTTGLFGRPRRADSRNHAPTRATMRWLPHHRCATSLAASRSYNIRSTLPTLPR